MSDVAIPCGAEGIRERQIVLLKNAVRAAARSEGVSIDALFRKIVGEKWKKALERYTKKTPIPQLAPIVEEGGFYEFCEAVLDGRCSSGELAALCAYYDDIYIPHINATDWRRNGLLAKPFISAKERGDLFESLAAEAGGLNQLRTVEGILSASLHSIGTSIEKNKPAEAVRKAVAWMGGIWDHLFLPNADQAEWHRMLALVSTAGIFQAIENGDEIVAREMWTFFFNEDMVQSCQDPMIKSLQRLTASHLLGLSRAFGADYTVEGCTLNGVLYTPAELEAVCAVGFSHVSDAKSFILKQDGLHVEGDIAFMKARNNRLQDVDLERLDSPLWARDFFKTYMDQLRSGGNKREPSAQWYLPKLCKIMTYASSFENSFEGEINDPFDCLEIIRRAMTNCNDTNHMRWISWYEAAAIQFGRCGDDAMKAASLQRIIDLYRNLQSPASASDAIVRFEKCESGTCSKGISATSKYKDVASFVLKIPPSLSVLIDGKQ